MGITTTVGNAILLTGNLLLAGALFFCFYRRQKENGFLVGRGGAAAFLAWEVGWLLEFTVYGACMTGIADIIINGIQAPESGNIALSVVRILLAESMMIIFLILKILLFLQRKDDLFAANGEFMLGMLLLLGLILWGWREPDGRRALAGQLICLMLFFVYKYLNRRRETEKRTVPVENAEGAGQEEYFKNVEQQYQRTRELWHDLKNHIRVLEILAEEERFGELTDYLGSFKRDVEHRMVPVRTGCAAVDALLGDKLYYAGRQGAEMSLQLCDLSRMRIREVDLCVILGNLLDNALEACAGLHGQGRIGLRMRQEEDFYYISVVNTSGEPLCGGEGYVSGKRDRDNGVGHGLGLRSAERIAHRYGGLLVTEYSDGEFRVVVRLQAGGLGGV